jgi:hypothetical protein
MPELCFGVNDLMAGVLAMNIYRLQMISLIMPAHLNVASTINTSPILAIAFLSRFSVMNIVSNEEWAITSFKHDLRGSI